MFPRILNALRAFPILASTSSSVPPVMFMTLPKYVKDVTSSVSQFAILMCSLDLLFTLMIFVLSVLILSPSFDEIDSSLGFSLASGNGYETKVPSHRQSPGLRVGLQGSTVCHS